MPEEKDTIFAAGLLLPVSAPAIRDGAVLVRDGRIADVGTLDDVVRRNPDSDARYFPRYTIIPGAVNAHAHLGFRRGDPPEGGTFSGWLAKLIERLPEKESWTAEAARASAREAIEAGTTFMAESSPYREGPPPAPRAGGGVGLSPVQYAESIELLAPQTIAAHLATEVSEEDVEILARTGVAAAHCPRSNDFLNCGVSPVPRMLERGVRVGMGTDGLWSSPSMNLFEEALFAVGLHGMSGATGLELATLGGARALGIEAEAGSLDAGKWADLAVIEALPDGGDPEREMLEAAAGGGVAATLVGGNLVYEKVREGG